MLTRRTAPPKPRCDVLDLTNHDNYGWLVIRQLVFFDGSAICPDTSYLVPIGNTLTPPRTRLLGMRFNF